MSKYNDYVYFHDYIEELHVRDEIHRCPDCGSSLVLHCEIRPGKSGTSYFDEIWVCPNCR